MGLLCFVEDGVGDGKEAGVGDGAGAGVVAGDVDIVSLTGESVVVPKSTLILVTTETVSFTNGMEYFVDFFNRVYKSR